LGGRGFDRLAGQFGQLSSVVSALPRSLADEVRARIATPAVDLSAVLRRLDDLGETFTDLVATVGAANDDAPPPMDAPGRGGSRALAPFSAAMSINAEPFLGPEMDALHGRLDYIAARIDRISDYIEGDAEPFRRGAKGAVVASGANAWEFESRETLRRLDDFGALLTRSGLAELPRVAEQIGASSQALASAIGEWRASSGSALTRPMVEDALERWFARLGRLGGQDAVIAAIEDLRAEAREARAFAPAAANDGGERIEGLGRAVVAVHGRFDEIVARLDRLAGRDDAAGRRGAALAAQDASAQGHAIERLDRVRDSIEALDARVETGNRAVSRVLALVEKQDGQDLGAKLEQSNQAIAETLLSFESRWEQPLAELREAVQRIVASAQSGSAAGPGHAGGPAATDSLVAALATMGGFMAAIEERFDALESVAEDVKAGSPDWTKSPGLATLSEGVGEMRRLTQEFLDISCAITDELASSAKAA
jgi:hypothetical protein